MESSDKRHKHHKKHKHKKHKKHRASRSGSGRDAGNEGDGGSTEQELEVEQIESFDMQSMDVIEEGVTLTGDEHHFLMDAEHCEGALEVIEELVEIDENDIGTINIEEMVLENYGQDYEELDVDVEDIEEDVLGDIEEDLLDELEESEEEDEEEEEDGQGVSAVPSTSRAILDSNPKLKAQLPTSEDPARSSKRTRDRSKKTKDDGDGSSGEEAWLNALESGKLEEVDDELKKMKNPKLMTARQRALLERKGELQTEEIIKEELVALPTGYKETVMTAELLKKKEIKSQRRREVAAQKREKEKKRTIDRLLLKKESKPNKSSNASGNGAGLTAGGASSGATSAAGGGGAGGAPSAGQVPSRSFTWRQTADGRTTLSLPTGVDFPLPAKEPPTPPEVIRCGVAGCSKPKRYSCSKTTVPLCSLECYRTNLKLHETGRST